MPSLSLPILLPVAALLDLSPYALSLGFAVVSMIFGGAMGIAGMYFHHQRQRLWHETARIALEKGRPLPNLGDAKDHRRDKSRDGSNRHDLRAGLILIGVGAGIYLFFESVGGAHGPRFIGAIPGFIGVALLLHALLNAVLPKKNPPSDERPAQL